MIRSGLEARGRKEFEQRLDALEEEDRAAGRAVPNGRDLRRRRPVVAITQCGNQDTPAVKPRAASPNRQLSRFSSRLHTCNKVSPDGSEFAAAPLRNPRLSGGHQWRHRHAGRRFFPQLRPRTTPPASSFSSLPLGGRGWVRGFGPVRTQVPTTASPRSSCAAARRIRGGRPRPAPRRPS